jgi:hypothetical protein
MILNRALSATGKTSPADISACTPEERDRVRSCCDDAVLAQYECACGKWFELEAGTSSERTEWDESCAENGYNTQTVVPPWFEETMNRRNAEQKWGWVCDEDGGCTHDAWSGLQTPGKKSGSLSWNQVPVRWVGTQLQVVGSSHTPWPALKNCSEPYDPSGDYVVPGAGLKGTQAIARVQAAGTGVVIPSESGVSGQVLLTRTTDNLKAGSRVTVESAIAAKDRELNTVDAALRPWEQGVRLARKTALRSIFEGLVLKVRDRKVEWAANGTRFDSCEEYAYEKFYRYHQYRDFIAAYANDYRAIFDVAIGKCPSAGRANASTLAKQLDPSLQRQVCGKSLYESKGQSLAVLPGNTGPVAVKNAFFEVEPAPDKVLVAAYPIKIWNDQGRQTVLSCVDKPTPEERRGCFSANLAVVHNTMLEGPVLRDNELLTAIRDAKQWEKTYREANSPRHDYPWHVKMDDGLRAAGVRDEELYAYDELKRELQRLLSQRAEVMKDVQGSYGGWSPPILVDDNPLSKYLWPILQQSLNTLVSKDKSNPSANIQNKTYNDLIIWAEQKGYPVPFVVALVHRTLTVWEKQTGRDASRYRYALEAAQIRWQAEHPDMSTATVQSTAGVQDVNNGSMDSIILSFVSKDVENNLSQVDFNSIEAVELEMQVFRIDERIESVLRTAMGLGCYAKTAALNPCDWSPRLFAETMQVDMDEAVQAAEDKCVKLTKGYGADFIGYEKTALKDKNLACSKSFEDIYSNSTYHFDGWKSTWKSAKDVWLAVRANAPAFEEMWNKVILPPCQQVATESFHKMREIREKGEAKPDHEEMGNSKVALYYDYSFDYGIENLEQYTSGAVLRKNLEEKKLELVELAAFANGQFRTGVKLFGSEFDIINVQAAIKLPKIEQPTNSQEKDKDFEYKSKVAWIVVKSAGIDFFSKGYNLSSNGSSKNNANTTKGAASGNEDGKDFSGTLFEVCQRFTVGPVPMSISAGLSGGMGIAFGPHMDVDYGLPNVQAVLDGSTKAEDQEGFFTAQLGVKIRPYAFLDVFATAAIDLVVVAAGVKANITLINASLPFVAAFGVGADLAIQRSKAVPVEVVKDNMGNALLDDLNNIVQRQDLVLVLPTFAIDFNTGMDLDIRTLDGYISLFAKVDLGFWGKTYQKKIVSWQGPRFSFPLFSYKERLAEIQGLGSISIPLYSFVGDSSKLSEPVLEN